MAEEGLAALCVCGRFVALSSKRQTVRTGSCGLMQGAAADVCCVLIRCQLRFLFHLHGSIHCCICFGESCLLPSHLSNSYTCGCPSGGLQSGLVCSILVDDLQRSATMLVGQKSELQKPESLKFQIYASPPTLPTSPPIPSRSPTTFLSSPHLTTTTSPTSEQQHFLFLFLFLLLLLHLSHLPSALIPSPPQMMRRTTLGPVSQNGLSHRQSLNPKQSDDRRASAFPSFSRRSTQQRPPRSTLSRSGARSDPRPLSDRQYMAATIRKIIPFLIDRGYDQPLSMKILSNPSGRDFQNIFLFLLRRLDPNFQVAQRKERPIRFEEELPTLLRSLRYPFAISKSVLSAVGSPHAWPQLLGVLSWIMGLCNYDEALTERQEADVSLDSQARREKLFYDNMVDAYSQFLSGQDTFPELDRLLDEHFQTDNQNREHEIEKLSLDCQQLESTLKALRTRPSPLSLSNEHKRSLETNIRKFKLLIPNLLEHAAAINKKLTEKDADLAASTAELQQLATEKARLVDLLARQEEAAIDVDRIAADREALRDALKHIGDERVTAEREQKDAENQVATATTAMSSSLKSFHRLIEKLSLKEGENDCRITVSKDASLTDASEILSPDTSDIMSHISELRTGFHTRIPELQELNLRLQEEIDEVEEKLLLMRHEISLVESRKNKLEDEYKTKKTQMTEQLQQRSELIISKEEQISVARQRLHERLRESDRRIIALQQQLRSFEEQFAEERYNLVRLVQNDISAFRKHQTEVRLQITAVRQHFDEESSRVG